MPAPGKLRSEAVPLRTMRWKQLAWSNGVFLAGILFQMECQILPMLVIMHCYLIIITLYSNPRTAPLCGLRFAISNIPYQCHHTKYSKSQRTGCDGFRQRFLTSCSETFLTSKTFKEPRFALVGDYRKKNLIEVGKAFGRGRRAWIVASRLWARTGNCRATKLLTPAQIGDNT